MRIQPWGLAMAVLVASACAKGDKTAQQPADSTARNLTLAPTESSAALHDVPAPTAQPPAQPAAPPPSRPPAPKPKPAPAPGSAAPATRTADAGTFVDLAVSDTLSSRFTKMGDCVHRLGRRATSRTRAAGSSSRPAPSSTAP